MTTLGRPRSFDTDDALNAAMVAFWHGGYEGTTYVDLEKATGLRRQSLSYVFGDKASLFCKALAHYIDQRVEKAAQLLRRDRPFRENLRNVLAAWEADVTSGGGRGCLLVRATAEVGGDPQMRDVIRRGDACLMNAFTNAFREAKERGDVISDVEPAALARLVISTGNGAMTQSVARNDPTISRGAHNTLITLLT